MRNRRSKRPLLLTLTASVVLHVLVVAAVRLPRDSAERALPIETPQAEPLQIEWITQVPAALPLAARGSGAPSDVERPLSETPLASSIAQPATLTLLADLKTGMQPVTALKGEPLPVDDASVRFDSRSAADAILSAPYPFPRVGGVRLGLGGGGSCPAVPTFP